MRATWSGVGATDEAAREAAHAAAATPRADTGWDLVTGLAETAVALLRTRGAHASSAFTDQITVEHARAIVLAATAEALAALGSPAEAADTARAARKAADASSGDPSRRAEAAARVVRALATTAPDEARSVAERIDDPWSRAEALVVLDPAAALSAAHLIAYPAWRAEAVAGIAAALARHAALDEALATADILDDPVWKAEALTGIAAAHPDAATAADLTGRALRTAAAVGHQWWSTDRLSAALARLTGMYDPRSLAAAMRPETHSRVLVGVARALADAHAPHALATVLTTFPPAPLHDWDAVALLAACTRAGEEDTEALRRTARPLLEAARPAALRSYAAESCSAPVPSGS